MYTKIKDVSHRFNGDAALYRLEDGSHVIASSVVAYSGPETLIFPANEDGDILDWLEIGGGRGYLDHDTALIEMLEPFNAGELAVLDDPKEVEP